MVEPIPKVPELVLVACTNRYAKAMEKVASLPQTFWGLSSANAEAEQSVCVSQRAPLVVYLGSRGEVEGLEGLEEGARF